MNTRIGLWLLLSLIALSFLMPGCTSPCPKESDYLTVDRGENALVVIGLRTRWNDTPSDPVKEFTYMSSSLLFLAVTSFDKAERLHQQRAFLLSESDSSGRQWTCIFLPAGSYYVWALPPTWLWRDVQFPLEQAGGFWLQVLPGRPVQYAGTLDYDLAGSKFLMEKFYKRFACLLIDERQDALAMVQTRLARFGGTMGVSLMLRYDQMLAYADPLFPTLVVTQSPDVIQSPDWKDRAWDKAAGPVRWMGEGSSGLGAVGALGFAIAYSPIYMYLGSSWAAEDIEKWQPCIDALNEQIEKTPPDIQLRQQIGSVLGNRAVVVEVDQAVIKDTASLATANGCTTLLLADIGRIQLRECDKNTFCVEVTTRIRLYQPRTNQTVCDWIFLYTNPDRLYNVDQSGTIMPYQILYNLKMVPYEIVLPILSTKRPMDDYCGTAGVELFTQELDRAIEQTVEHFTECVLLP